MLSGGVRTRQGMIEALRGGAVDLIGLARPLAHEPDLARRLLAGTAEASLVRPHTVGHKVIDDLLNDHGISSRSLGWVGASRCARSGRRGSHWSSRCSPALGTRCCTACRPSNLPRAAIWSRRREPEPGAGGGVGAGTG